MEPNNIRQIEAVLLMADSPLTARQIHRLFPEEIRPSLSAVKEALAQLQNKYNDAPEQVLMLKEVASGFRFQLKSGNDLLIQQFKKAQQPRCSRTLLETLAIIAYQQPITRAQIEAIRGVRLNPAIMKQLLEYGWIEQTDQLAAPGRPGLYATTKQFLDDFNLKSLHELPHLD